MLLKKILFIAFLFISTQLFSAEFKRPGKIQFITDAPSTLVRAWNLSFNTKSRTLYSWGGIFLSTAALYYYDEEILHEFRRFGKRIGLGNDDHTKSFVRVGSISIFRGPTDFASTLYFLGDGWMHAFIGIGFAMTGLAIDSNRAITTGSQILNSMISSTVVNQIAKRSFGRESPYRSNTRPRGRWRPFPSISTYNNDISAYDAMPTGHLMTAASTFTILDENYPEHRDWIRPLAATWMTLLSFQMVNNGVHWISDYPLGIMMGYVFGKAATQVHNPKTDGQASYQILPIHTVNNYHRTYGLSYTLKF